MRWPTLMFGCEAHLCARRRRSDKLGRGESGLALIATLLVMVLVSALAAAALSAALSNLRTSTADYRDARVFYAAEAGAEAALSGMELAVKDGVIAEAELLAITPPDLDGFDFAEFRVITDGPIIVEKITDGPFAGLYALTQKFEVTSIVTDDSGARGGVVLGGKAQAIPIFQFGWFCEGGCQFAAGALWHAWGRVHSNRGLFLGGCDQHFHEPLTTTGGVYRDGYAIHLPVPTGCINNWIDDASATEVYLDFDSEDTTDPDAFKAKSEAKFDSRLQTDAFGVDSLKLPLPEGVPPRELVEPREVDDTDAEKEVKFAWKADMYVTVDLDDLQNKNTACGGSPPPGAPARMPNITVTRYNGFTAVPNDADKCKIFNFRWESFYDNHEEGWVDVLDVDLAALKDWFEIGPGDSTAIVYVEWVNAGASPPNPGVTDPHHDGTAFDGSYHPVMKLVNGSELHGPLTIGSHHTVYVQGHYNNVNWKPSAVFGDAMGFLSENWDDSNAVPYDNPVPWCWSTSLCPDAVDTEQYFAMIAANSSGLIGCYHEDPSCFGPTPYTPGGGIMLEDWRHGPGRRWLHTWVGSSISLYTQQHASQWWNFPNSDYYDRPDRDHRFETRFTDPTKLPPGTPLVGSILRAWFRPVY